MISDRLFRYLCDSKLFPLSDSWFLSLFHQRSYFLFLLLLFLLFVLLTSSGISHHSTPFAEIQYPLSPVSHK